nr:MAG TPA: hypothetical protein [Bacteriophage sp.]
MRSVFFCSTSTIEDSASASTYFFLLLNVQI